MYENVLEFKGTWRVYQKRVLDHFDYYKADHKVHIVAAPGSGKTILGIELIKRFDRPALVLVPTITIREQWIERIKEMFLNERINTDDYFSQDLKNMKWVTVATYQSLHSAMTRYQGVQVEDNEEFVKEENVDFMEFDLFEEIKQRNIQTICLDECHHLRSEWWKSLEQFKKQANILYTVSLTATPPYDSEASMWKRYIDMCGEIDEEITVPELVKEGSLCPHQDYVYFNYPTKQEEQEINHFKIKSHEMMNLLMNDTQFQTIIQSHRYLHENVDLDLLLEKPAYLSSLLIYLDTKHLSYPSYYQEILGYDHLEKMSEKWMEILLQGLLYDDTDSYMISKSYYEELMKELKSRGLIENRKVTLQVNQAIEKMLVKSVGKCESIQTIVFHEYQCMKDQLKLLILTDYIKKDYQKAIGNENKDVHNLGVLPFFEMLRRENEQRHEHLKIGVLCGTMVIIPTIGITRLKEIVPDYRKISFHKLGSLSEENYVEVKINGEDHFIIQAISQLFEEGYMHVLIGTKSLLGEGWDSPCVNTLILASFVGSYMLSNQLRGRDIRTYKNNPQKSSHIWHLVCVNPQEDNLQDSEDFVTLKRRMEHFLGLHYDDNIIENGIARLTSIAYPLTKYHIKKTNQAMLKKSSERSQLKQRWDDSLAIFDQIDVVEENNINEHFITSVLFHDALRKYLIMTICFLLALIIGIPALLDHFIVYIYVVICLSLYLMAGAFFVPKIFQLRNPMGRLKVFGRGIYHALKEMNLLESENSCVKTESYAMNHMIYLSGGTGHDKDLFAKCVSQFFSEIDNQRYILYRPSHKNKLDGYFAVPDVFAKKKEDALFFGKCMKPFIGQYEVVYTRHVEGRKILLQGRIKALANKEERCIQKKKVKSALE